MNQAPVLIVGAGPAGLVTAIGLARHGVGSVVIERHPSTSIFPRATGVSVRSMEIFRSWGIDEAVRRGGWRVVPRQATVKRLDDRNPVEGALGFPDDAACLAVSPTTAAVSPQDHLEPVLVELYRSLGGDIRFSTELVSFEQDGDGVIAVVRDRTTGGTTDLRADYLVGADGHRSAVRTRLGIAMEGPDDLGQYVSVLFRADLTGVLREPIHGLYVLEGEGPPMVLVPSGADDRFVLGVPLPPDVDEAAVRVMFPPERGVAMIRAAAGRPDLDVEILATNTFAFSAQVADRWRVGRAFLVGDAAHRMTPRGGRGMNTAIADAHNLAWKLAWVVRGLAAPPLLDTYEAERGPIGRRNVALSMSPGAGGSDDGLAEDLGSVAGSGELAFPPDARPGSRAPHAWLGIGTERISTLDLFGREMVLLAAGGAVAWRCAVTELAANGTDAPIRVRSVGRFLRDAEGGFATAYGLTDGGAALVRPDGIVAARWASAPADHRAALDEAIQAMPGCGPAQPAASAGADTEAA